MIYQRAHLTLSEFRKLEVRFENLTMNQLSVLRLILFQRLRARLVILAISLLAALFGLATPYFQKLFIDSFAEQKTILPDFTHYDQSPLFLIVIAFFLMVIAQGFNLLSSYLGNKEAILAQKKIGEFLYEKMLSLKRDSRNARPVGETVSIFATEIPGATMLVEQVLPMGAGIFFPLILAPAAIHYLYGVPLWSTMITMLAVASINLIMSLRQSRFFYRFKQLAAERTGIVNEWIQNIRALRILGWIDRFERRIFLKREEETRNRVAMVTNGQTMNAIASTITFFINITGVASLIYVQKRPLEPGVLLALFWIFAVFLVRPFRQFPWFFVFLMDGFSSVRRIQNYLSTYDLGEEDEREAMAAEPMSLRGPRGIRVEGLNSTINGTPLLKNINFDVRPGEFVAIVGEVGSGKSLLLLSLMREIQATFGKYNVTFNNEEFNALQLKTSELRSHYAFVSQEGFVMSATLRQNALFEYDVENAFDAEISRVLKVAQFDLEKEVLSDGLETEIGEKGVNLSGGQRQRVALARAALSNRPILLLDDCLSAVDVYTEKQLIEHLFFDEWRNQTRILVTHRLSVLTHADRIFFMKDGEILASGEFEDLIEESREFREYTLSIMQNEPEKEKEVDNELIEAIDENSQSKEGASDGES